MLTSKKDHWSQTKRQDNAVSNGSFPLLHTKIGLYSKGSKGQSVGEVNITSIMSPPESCQHTWFGAYPGSDVVSWLDSDIQVCLSGLYVEALHAPRRHEAALFQASINALPQWPDVRLIAKGVE